MHRQAARNFPPLYGALVAIEERTDHFPRIEAPIRARSGTCGSHILNCPELSLIANGAEERVSSMIPAYDSCGDSKSCLMQDEPGGRGCFACKMSLERGSAMLGIDDRSEERRVGKECRSRWSPYH